MADKDFIVKNGIVANTSFSANSTTVSANGILANSTGTYVTGTVNAASHTVGTSTVANSTGVYTGVVNGSSITVGTSTIANTTGVYTGVVNGSSITVGTSTVSNATGVYTTGTVNAASHTVGTSTVANATGVYTGIINAASHTVGTSTVANATGVYVGSNVSVTAAAVSVGNATINTAISAASIAINGQSANGIGTGAGQLLALDSSARIPAVNGALLTSVGSPVYNEAYTNAAAGQAKVIFTNIIATGNVAVPTGVKGARIYTFGAGGGNGGSSQAYQGESYWSASGGSAGNWGYAETILNNPSGNLTFTFGTVGQNGASYAVNSRTNGQPGTPGNPGGATTVALNGQTLVTITAAGGGQGSQAAGGSPGSPGANSTLQGQFINPPLSNYQYNSQTGVYNGTQTLQPGIYALGGYSLSAGSGWNRGFYMDLITYQFHSNSIAGAAIGTGYYGANIHGNIPGFVWGYANAAALIKWLY